MGGIAFELERLRERLRPWRLHWYPTLRSTNDQAARMRRSGTLYAPAVVLTGRQTAGRGRGGNVWHAPGGTLTVTFVLPIDERVEPYQVPLIAGLAVRNAAAQVSGNDRVALKWPNDLLYQGRKLGGLLCERVEKADLIGVGLNVNLEPRELPTDLRDAVSSIREATAGGSSLDMTDTLIAVANHLRDGMTRAAERPFSATLREYDAHHALVGLPVSVIANAGEEPLTGQCEGMDAMGRLLLRNATGVHHVISGHVVMR